MAAVITKGDMMFNVEFKGFEHLERRLKHIIEGLPQAAEQGVEKALKQTADVAIRLAPGVVGKSIKVEMLDRSTGEILGRVYTDTKITYFAPYVEFGTGVDVDDQGNKEAIRLKRAKSIPWYIHISMVPASFAKYGYPLIEGQNGEKYYVVDGMKPHPYMHPAAFNERDHNVKAVADALSALVRGAE